MGGFEIPVLIVIVLSRDRDPVIAGDDAELRQEDRALVAPPQDQLEKLRERLNLLA